MSSRAKGLKQLLSSKISSLKSSGLEMFAQLDESIGQQYREEIEAVKQLVIYVQEQIETKSKLPAVKLDGNKLIK